MQYMFLICSGEGSGPVRGSREFQEMMAGYGAFTQEVRKAEIMKQGAPLQSVDTATTMRVHGGKPETYDGPLAETKEVLGGYYILECENLDEALTYAAPMPLKSRQPRLARLRFGPSWKCMNTSEPR